MNDGRRPPLDEITVKDQLLAGLGLVGLMLVWLIFLIPTAIWLLISLLLPRKADA
jgi:hypothetical protein